jgi:hypothetical protein
MTNLARGTFAVNITPQPPEDKSEGLTLGRMLIEKKFQGDLEAVSNGQMLTGMTEVKGSGAYVAVERVTGTSTDEPAALFFTTWGSWSAVRRD